MSCWLLAAGLAQASPVTFRFDMPDWQRNHNPALFGSHIWVDFTLDNGASSSLGQVYLNSDIKSARVRAIGGSLDMTFTSFSGALGESYISTNAAGIPLLDLLARPVDTAIVGADFATDTHVQFGRITPDGGFTTLWLSQDHPRLIRASLVPSDGDQFVGLSVQGVRIDAFDVPEPASWSLLLLLGLGVATVHRRRKA
ncbi:PEP-CTERM sorting domain-containing protein [Pelomonas sp. APW6]|uniref:PEP-CTERM sorting domain-containing protein n=1 Tax=Roseateles subflavus TaxID=3053353 RepID=A0ABT7LE66_9BURK|nr:PEP-CTERM sorting domain-containing protein [Pelomonas sp. APW6]MDL5031159.1 PEP-CTERM sorting domain-containing protein [Pelomonas sp. APW6]